MTDFVLVAGAWLGGWAWDEVAAELRAAGHNAHPLTLSGLAGKRDRPAGQQTHVRDIVTEVERLDLPQVVLVGHSYAGIPVGQAACHLGDRLAHVVFVDSNVPVHGKSFLAEWSEAGRAEVVAEIAANNGYWPPLPPEDYADHDLTAAQITRIVARSTPHPGTTLTEPAILNCPLEKLPATYLTCRATPPEAAAHWQRVDLNTGHWPMFSRPRELARLLVDRSLIFL